MDGDCELEQGFLPAALKAVEGDAALGVVAGSRRDFYRTRKGIVAAKGEYYQHQRTAPSEQLGYGGCALYRREALEAAGSFNPFLGSWEEKDLSHRIARAGFHAKVMTIPMIRHTTVPRESLRRLLRTFFHGFYLGRGQAARLFLRRRMVRAAFAGLSRVLVVLAHAAVGMASLALWLLGGVQWPLALWAVLSVAGFVTFALRSRSVYRAGYYTAEWLIQGVCLILGFFVPTPSPDTFRWKGEERDPPGTGIRPLPRVLLVGPRPDPPFWGGVERGVDLLLRSRIAGRTSMRLFNNYRRRDANRWFPERLAYQAGMIRAFRKELSRHAFDLVHIKTSSGVNFHQNALYALAARMAGLPVVLQIHCGKFPTFYEASSRLVRTWIRHSLSGAAFVAVLSDAWAERIRAIAPRTRTRIIPNGLEDRELDLLHEPATRSRPVVLFMGTGEAELNREKGLEDLLGVIPELAGRYPESCWVLAGLSDAERRDVRMELSRSITEPPAEQIRCLGLVDGREKLSLLRSSSILVLPSYFENMPNVLLEAMAAGMAVVATAVGAVPEMLGHGEGGLLVEPGDREALRQALEHLLGLPSQVYRQGLRNRETVARRYTMSVVERKLEEVYMEAARWRIPNWDENCGDIRPPGSGVPGSVPFVSCPATKP